MNAPHDVLEHNLRLLFARSWLPVQPSAAFSARLRARLGRELRGAGAAPRRLAPVQRRWLAAALVLLVSAAIAWILRGAGTRTIDDILAEGDVAVATADGWRPARADELRAGIVGGDGPLEVATPAASGAAIRFASAGSVELQPRSRAAVTAAREAGARDVAVRNGTVDVDRAPGGAAWGVDTLHGRVELGAGRLRVESDAVDPAGQPCAAVELDDGRAWIVADPRVDLVPGERTHLRGGRVVTAAAGLAAAEGAAVARTSIEGAAPVETPVETIPHDPSRARLAVRLIYEEDVAPPARYRVSLLRHMRLPQVSFPETSEHADAAGFAIDGLVPGRYDLFVEAEGFAVVRRSALDLSAGTTAHAVEIALARGTALRGRVVSAADGAPLADAWVLVENLVPAQVLPFEPEPDLPRWLASARTHADGAFHIANLPPGRHRVRASHADHAAQWIREIPVEPGTEPAAVELRLGNSGAIEGLVLRDDGSAWPGARVIASRIDLEPPYDRMSYGTAQADADGRYEIGGLPAGSYVVFCVDRAAQASGVPAVREALLAAGGRTRADLGPTVQRTRLVGTVKNPSGVPVPALDVMLQREGADVAGGWIAERTGADGSFAFAGVDPGSYRIYTGRSLGTSFVSAGAIEIPLLPEMRHDIVLPAGRIRGRVLGPDGAAVGGAWIILLADREPESEFLGRTQADPDGSFEFEGLSARSYALSIHAQDDLVAARFLDQLWLESGSALQVEARLEPGAALEVQLVDADGKPLAGRPVRFTDAAGRVRQFAPDDRTDAGGRYRAAGLAPGRWSVEAGAAPAQHVDLAAGERRTLKFTVGSR